MSTLFGELRTTYKLDYSLEPQSALVIRAGSDSPDPTAPDNPFVRVDTSSGRTVYIPGASVKGIVRSHTESLLRAMKKEVCGFTHYRGSDCGKKQVGPGRQDTLENEDRLETRYSGSCHACRMFGSTALGSILRFDDLFPYRAEDPNETRTARIEEVMSKLKTRYGIKIDRKSGSVVEGALYDIECLAGGEFYGTIILKNPEMWQLAILLTTIEHINMGFQKVGGLKSRGFGKVKIKLEKLTALSSAKAFQFTLFKNGKLDTEKLEGLLPEPIESFPPYIFELDSQDLDKLKTILLESSQNRW